MGTEIAISYAHNSLIRFNNSTQQKMFGFRMLGI